MSLSSLWFCTYSFCLSLALSSVYFRKKEVNDTFVYDEDHLNLVGLLCLTVEDGSFRDMVFLEASAS